MITSPIRTSILSVIFILSKADLFQVDTEVCSSWLQPIEILICFSAVLPQNKRLLAFFVVVGLSLLDCLTVKQFVIFSSCSATNKQTMWDVRHSFDLVNNKLLFCKIFMLLTWSTDSGEKEINAGNSRTAVWSFFFLWREILTFMRSSHYCSLEGKNITVFTRFNKIRIYCNLV